VAVGFSIIGFLDSFDSLALFLVTGVPLAVVGFVVVLVVHVKLLLVSEACFIDGCGVVGSLRRSWRTVGLRRAKTVFLVGSFSVVLGVLLFGTGGGNEINLGNVGISSGDAEAGTTRIAASVAMTALYSALFSHLYLERELEARD